MGELKRNAAFAEMTQKRLKSHDFLVMMTSGVFARAVAIGLDLAGTEAASAVAEICFAWQLLLQPVIKPEVRTSILNLNVCAI